MANPRFFLSEPLGDVSFGATYALPLSSDDLHHAVNVLRVLPSEKIELVSPDATLYLAKISSVSKSGIDAEIQSRLEPPFEPNVTLIQGVSKGERMELCIRMAVEIGVRAIVPVLCSRSVVKLDEGKRVDRVARWTRIARSAARQSGRISTPEIRQILTTAELESVFSAFDLVVVAWEESSGASIGRAISEAGLQHGGSVAIVIGPEGGFTADEVERFIGWGARIATLGDTILRTETAGVVAAALAIAELGGLGYERS